MKKLFAYIMVLVLSVQLVPQAFAGGKELAVIETSLDHKGNQKLSKDETEKHLFNAMAVPQLNDSYSSSLFILTSERLLAAARDVIVPPPDCC